MALRKTKIKIIMIVILFMVMIVCIYLRQSINLTNRFAETQLDRERKHIQINSPIAKNVPKKASPLGTSHEILRRRSLRLVNEMRFSLKGKLDAWKADGQLSGINRNNQLLADLFDIFNYLEVNLEGLGLVDGAGDTQRMALQLLSETFTKSIRSNQEPVDCQKAKYALLDIDQQCGFGCQMHGIVFCLFFAYGSNRVLQLSSNTLLYSPAGFSSFFEPLSRCQPNLSSYDKGISWFDPNADSTKHLYCPKPWETNMKPPYAPTAVPASIAAELHRLHGAPNVWVVGHFAAYVMRLKPGAILKIINRELAAVIGKNFEELDLEPIVGMHIRRTDKINTEAAFHSLDEYMVYAKEYFDKLDAKRLMVARTHEWMGDGSAQKLLQITPRRRIFIASDDPSVFLEARNSYPDYEFYFNSERAKSASPTSRYSKKSLVGLLTDVMILSHSNFIVCTFSSQICRLSYELMQTRALKLGDASSLVQSLDDSYYYGGAQRWPFETLIADKKVNLKAGDLVDYLGNHWNGEAKISHQGKTYIVPAYKFERRLQSVPYGPVSLINTLKNKNT